MADGPRRLLKRPRPKYFKEELKSDFKRFKQKFTFTDSKPLAKLKELTREAIEKLNAGDPELLWKLIYEFAYAKLTWGTTTVPVGAWITRTCGSPVPDNVARVIVEVFDAIHSETPTHKDKIMSMQKDLTTFKNCMSDDHFKSHSSTLDLFLDPQQKSMVKGSRTQMYYKQETFNLFLEDSEGFAKLVTYLGEIASQNLDIPFERFVNNLEIIIGRFGLNTDRVLDCVLHALELNSTNALLIRYLRTVPKESVTQILGFKFRGFVLPETANTPHSLYQLAIRLYEKDLIDLQLLLPHLSPSMDQTLTKRYQVEKEERDAAVNLLKHNLNESESDRQKRQQSEAKAVAARKRNRLEETKNHQLLELLNAALQPDSFNLDLVQMLFDMLETAVPASRKSIRNSLFCILQDLVEPVYEEHFSQNLCLKGFGARQKPNSTEAKKGWTTTYYGVTGLDDFPKKILPLMRWLTVYACANPEVCSLIARVLAQCVRLNTLKNETYAQQIEELMCLLCGASGSMGYNVGISNDIWGVLSLLPYDRRFAIYGYWRFTIYPKYSEMMYIRNEEIKHTKYFMKRYHVDEADPRTIGRKIARLVHRNPTVVLDEILTQLESYSKNISMLAEAMRYFNHLTQDILIWVSICHMEQSKKGGLGRPMIEPDGVPTKWFSSLSTLIALFFQKTSHGDLDVAPVIQYIINKLHAGSSVQLLLFAKIISRVSGIESFGETITDGQLDALGGSRLLQFLAIHGDSKGPGRKTMIRHCIKTMFDQKQILPIFILLSHTKDNLSSGHLDDELESRYPVISDLIDRVNNCFVQLFSFLELSEPICGKNESLGPILPSFADIVMKYGMSHAFAFHICRAHFGDLRISSHPEAGDDAESDAFQALEKTCEMLLDSETLAAITPSFYACFWAYRTKDIHVPTLQYNQHGEKLQKQMSALKKKSDASSKKELKRLESDLNTLKKDKQEQMKTFKTISQKVLGPKQAAWFEGVANPESTISTVLFKCVIPRLCISDVDAKYCSHFVLYLTNEGTPGFEFISFVWEIIQSFIPIVRSLTNAEARRFARFFSTLLHGVEQWRVDDGKFRAFVKSPAAKVPESSFLPQIKTKGELCSILKLFRSLLTESIILCLKEKEDPRCQKNCIIFLHHMINQYPKIQTYHKALKQAIENLDLVKDSPMDLLVKRVKVILDKKYSSCVSSKEYGGRDLLEKPKAKAPGKKRDVEMKDTTKKAENKKKAAKKAPAKKAAPKAKQTANPKSKTEMDALLQKRLKDEQEKKKTETKKSEEKTKKRKAKEPERKSKKQKTGKAAESESDWK